MHSASGITGLTLPGMIELPGCSAGNSISPRPASGPEFIQRRSLPIFINATASALSWPDSSTEIVLRRETLELVVGGFELRPCQRRQRLRHRLAETRVGIDAGADRGAADRQAPQALERCPRCAPAGRDCILASAKQGIGVDEILEAIVASHSAAAAATRGPAARADLRLTLRRLQGRHRLLPVYRRPASAGEACG